jgi:hypothetical protein
MATKIENMGDLQRWFAGEESGFKLASRALGVGA